MGTESAQFVEGMRSDYTNTSRKIFIGPCRICCVMLAADGVNGDCQVYDGESANDLLKAHIEALSGTTFHWNPRMGVLFERGIYIVVSASTSKVTITYLPESRKGDI